MYKCSLERMSDKIRTFAQFGDAGHLAIKDGSSLGVFRCGDVDAVVGDGDFV